MSKLFKTFQIRLFSFLCLMCCIQSGVVFGAAIEESMDKKHKIVITVNGRTADSQTATYGDTLEIKGTYSCAKADGATGSSEITVSGKPAATGEPGIYTLTASHPEVPKSATVELKIYPKITLHTPSATVKQAKDEEVETLRADIAPSTRTIVMVPSVTDPLKRELVDGRTQATESISVKVKYLPSKPINQYSVSGSVTFRDSVMYDASKGLGVGVSSVQGKSVKRASRLTTGSCWTDRWYTDSERGSPPTAAFDISYVSSIDDLLAKAEIKGTCKLEAYATISAQTNNYWPRSTKTSIARAVRAKAEGTINQVSKSHTREAAVNAEASMVDSAINVTILGSGGGLGGSAYVVGKIEAKDGNTEFDSTNLEIIYTNDEHQPGTEIKLSGTTKSSAGMISSFTSGDTAYWTVTHNAHAQTSWGTAPTITFKSAY